VRSQPKAPLASLSPNPLKSCSIRYSNFNNLACFKPDIACCPRSPSITHSRRTGDTTGHHPCLECPCRRGRCEQIDVLELDICSKTSGRINTMMRKTVRPRWPGFLGRYRLLGLTYLGITSKFVERKRSCVIATLTVHLVRTQWQRRYYLPGQRLLD